MTIARGIVFGLTLSTVALCVISCGGSSSSSNGSDGNGVTGNAGGNGNVGGNAGGNGNGNGNGNAGGNANAGGGVSVTGGNGSGKGGGVSVTGGAGGAKTCGGEHKAANPTPFDMYLLFDKSGSMSQPTSNGDSKLTAVEKAVTSFVEDKGSDGIGFALQFFPVLKDAPATCTAEADCTNGAGPCTPVKVCDTGMKNPPTQCDTDGDCPSGQPCLPLGLCLDDPDMDNPASCVVKASGQVCDCGQLPGKCINRQACDVPSYATPAADFTVLPAGADATVASMMAIEADGETPLGPALEGALQHAAARSTQNPTHKVVAVLATDGLPSACDPQDVGAIADLAGQGATGTPPIDTYIIGVLSQQNVTDGADKILDSIAKKGGTQKAFILDDKADVEKSFLTALNVIRGAALSCTYDIPQPTSGKFDPTLVNVNYTPGDGGAVDSIYYVANDDQCDAVSGGWHYDVDPATGGTPTEIVLCPATCETVQADQQAKIDVELGCPTITPPIH